MKKPAGNMYSFIDEIWNPVRGKCLFDCSYCYAKRWGAVNPPHLNEQVLNKDLGENKFIFICSGCDLFAPDIPALWVNQIIEKTSKYYKNRYLWHTKNPRRLTELIDPLPNDIACVTVESNRAYPAVSKAPFPFERISYIREWHAGKMITVEPVMDFDTDIFTGMIKEAGPVQVNIGADSGGNGLPEPPAGKILELIENLKPYMTVHLKKNLIRIIGMPAYLKHALKTIEGGKGK